MLDNTYIFHSIKVLKVPRYLSFFLNGLLHWYTLSEARSGVDWANLMAAQGAFGTDFYDKSTRTIVGTML